MQVIRARVAGACFGVERALKLAFEAHDAQSLGALIHNPAVVCELADAGVKSIDTLDQLSAQTLIVRTHGVGPQIYEQVKARGKHCLDATCPYVKRVQKAACNLCEEGFVLIIFGEEGHPEVQGIYEHARQYSNEVYIATKFEDLPLQIQELAATKPVGIVVQTTQRLEDLNNFVDALKACGINPCVKNTICSATRERQDAALELASTCDCMVVIGGKNSSNTQRLVEICQSVCPFVVPIEHPGELEQKGFSKFERVGITAGASTPESHIVQACEILKSYA